MTGALSKDLALAARSTATVVILMGMKKLREIMELFQACGRGDTPVAVIQNGTLASQQHAVGTASTIVDLVRAEDLGSPGIIVVGEVVKFAPVVNAFAAAHLDANH